LDLRRGAAPLYPLRQFALVVLLFPHLIAGPIVRHRELVPQFDLDPRREGLARRLTLGALLFSIGLVQKVLLAEPMALIVDPIFVKAQTAALSFGEAWTAALGFSFQLLFDFSGYSTMAIGIALMLGLTFPENFNRPYLATNLRDFWRRWHMTLSAFLRDYVYIPLGGNRHGAAVFTFATLATMTLCGVWHGAAWTFIAWGGLHGAGMVVCRAWQTLQRPLPAAIGWALTMGFVLIGWVLFRAPSFGVAADMLKIMAGSNGFGGRLEGGALMLLSAVVCAALPPTHAIIDGARPSALLGAASALATLACVLIVGEGAPTKFIYFQF
jgi:D-alanyl-lipoteichoic acid acyltransferase DltB (MBOAT superfamily)